MLPADGSDVVYPRALGYGNDDLASLVCVDLAIHLLKHEARPAWILRARHLPPSPCHRDIVVDTMVEASRCSPFPRSRTPPDPVGLASTMWQGFQTQRLHRGPDLPMILFAWPPPSRGASQRPPRIPNRQRPPPGFRALSSRRRAT